MSKDSEEKPNAMTSWKRTEASIPNQGKNKKAWEKGKGEPKDKCIEKEIMDSEDGQN